MGMVYPVNGVYYFGVKVGDKWVRRSSRSRDEVEAKKQQILLQDRIDRGEPLEEPKTVEEKAGQTFADACEEYVRHNKKRGKDIARTVSALNHFKAAFGKRGIADITRADVDSYITRRLDQAKAGTVAREVGCLKAVCNYAIRKERLTANPAAKMTIEGANKPRQVLLSEAQIAALVDACHGELRDMVRIALLSGMHLGEIVNLTKGDVDFVAGRIELRKTKSGRPRLVPMHPDVWDILNRRCIGAEDARCKEERVFTVRYIHPAFRTAVKRANLGDLRFHDLRHVAASYLLMRGADVRTVMQILGHADPQMTLRVYALVSDEHMREAVNRLNYDMTRTSTVSNVSIPSSLTSGNR